MPLAPGSARVSGPARRVRLAPSSARTRSAPTTSSSFGRRGPVSRHGVTLVDFGLFDLVDKQLSPCIRDLGKITLFRMGTKADYEERFPKVGPLLTKNANLDLVASH